MADRTSKSHQRDELEKALEDSFPASDPISLSNPSTGTKAEAPAPIASPAEALDGRIHARAEKLWRAAGSPPSGEAQFLDEARTLIAIEDNPRAGTLPNPMTHPDNIGPEGEPIESPLAVENEGEFPTLTDQGDQVYPPRQPGRR